MHLVVNGQEVLEGECPLLKQEDILRGRLWLSTRHPI